MNYLYNGLFVKALCKNSYFVDYLVNYSVDYLCYGNVFFKMLDFSFRTFVKALCKNYLIKHLKDYFKKKLLGNANGNEKVAPLEGLFGRIGLLRYRDRLARRHGRLMATAMREGASKLPNTKKKPNPKGASA